MEDLLQGNTEDVRDAEGNFERGRVLITFNGIDGLTSNEDAVGEFLLCHGAGAAEFMNSIADSRTHCLPTPCVSLVRQIERYLMLGRRYSTKEITNANKGGNIGKKMDCDLLLPISEVAPRECHADIR